MTECTKHASTDIGTTLCRLHSPVDGPFTGLYRTVSLQPASSDSSQVDLLQEVCFCTAEQDIQEALPLPSSYE